MRRIWVTRDEGDDGPLAGALRRVGLSPVVEPVIERRIVSDAAEAILRLGPRDWLVLTSVRAIEAIDASRVPCRVAVVGEPSRRAAEARGLRVERMSDDGTGATLWRSLRESSDGATRVCFPRSSLAPVPQAWPGIELEAPVVYETRPRPFDASVARAVAVAAVTSPSAAAALASAPKGADLQPLRCASIGPTTSAALRRASLEPWLESPAPDFETLAAAIAAKLEWEKRR